MLAWTPQDLEARDIPARVVVVRVANPLTPLTLGEKLRLQKTLVTSRVKHSLKRKAPRSAAAPPPPSPPPVHRPLDGVAVTDVDIDVAGKAGPSSGDSPVAVAAPPAVAAAAAGAVAPVAAAAGSASASAGSGGAAPSTPLPAAPSSPVGVGAAAAADGDAATPSPVADAGALDADEADVAAFDDEATESYSKAEHREIDNPEVATLQRRCVELLVASLEGATLTTAASLASAVHVGVLQTKVRP